MKKHLKYILPLLSFCFLMNLGIYFLYFTPQNEEVQAATYTVTIEKMEGNYFSEYGSVAYYDGSGNLQYATVDFYSNTTVIYPLANSILRAGSGWDQGVLQTDATMITDTDRIDRRGYGVWFYIDKNARIEFYSGGSSSANWKQTLILQNQLWNGSQYVNTDMSGAVTVGGYTASDGKTYSVDGNATFKITAAEVNQFDGFFINLSGSMFNLSQIYTYSGRSLTYSPFTLDTVTIYARWTNTTVWVDINAYNPSGVQDYQSALFDLTIYNTSTGVTTSYPNQTNEPGYGTVGYGSRLIITNIRSYVKDKYTLSSVGANQSGCLTASGETYTYTVGANSGHDVIAINMVWINYSLDLNGYLDRTSVVDIYGYGYASVKIDGTTVSTNAGDYYNTTLHLGQTYEIYNITAYENKIYRQVYSGSLTGTIESNVEVVLQFDTNYWQYEAASSYGGGGGTSSNPYIINTAQQLARLAINSWSSTLSGQYFKVNSNIDLSGHIWQPISNNSYKFGGTFDGNMKLISNIKNDGNNVTKNDCQGLFGRVANGTIKNVIMMGGSISARDSGAAVVAIIEGGLVQNCLVQGLTVNVDIPTAGGLVGANYSARITSCYVKDTIVNSSGTAHYGGLIGYSQSGTIKDCNAVNVRVTASNAPLSTTGVFLGYNAGGNTIEACYGQGVANGTTQRFMYGGSSTWGNWSYTTTYNNGLPVQTPLFAIGGITGSTQVYNYLVGLGYTVL